MNNPETASELAKKYFGITGNATRLHGEYDANFHINSETGKHYILKISHTGVDTIDLQNSILKTIENQHTFKKPTLVTTLDNQLIAEHLIDQQIHYVRLFDFVPGTLLGEMSYHSPDLLYDLGKKVGHLTQSLTGLSHPFAQRNYKWDLQQALWIKNHLNTLTDTAQQECVSYFINEFSRDTLPRLAELPKSIIHGDINDNNIVADKNLVIGFIDFGDLIHTATICELAITIAYAILKKVDPLTVSAHLIRGYNSVRPLSDAELHVLFNLICMRLCVSVVNSSLRKKKNPQDSYLTISEAPAWEMLFKLRQLSPNLALYTFRDACDLEPCPQTTVITAWLKTNAPQIGCLLQKDPRALKKAYLDLSPASNQAYEFEQVVEKMQQEGTELIIGKYNEARLVYQNAQYTITHDEGSENRTIHLGVDLFQEANTAIYTPLDAIVHSVKDNNLPQDFGPTIILEHALPQSDIKFYTLYGHLSRESLTHVIQGQSLKKGDIVGWLGDATVNGGWVPHLHFQIITDLLNYHDNYAGVALPSKRRIWLSLCPDPNLFLRIPENELPPVSKTFNELLADRKRLSGKNLSLSYDTPLHIVRGEGQYLYDSEGRQYVDCVNNVAHVGHCHPKVVAAGQRQMAVLNTNTRYLHENFTQYAEKLIATLPKPLEVCFFVCSGSEANELALRLAKTYTSKNEIVVIDHAYHGNTTSLIDISPYKFNGKGGKGKPDFVHVLPIPDSKYCQQDVQLPVLDKVAAFIYEPILSCAGQVVLPMGYVKQISEAIHQAGGICIADEIQVGLGRVGTHMWGFETHEVIPDIVTMGKPLGNGHPIGAVVTTREIADAFCNGMEYFNTFGGNPVSCAIGTAVLEVIREEKLQAHALQIGSYFRQQLQQLKDTFPCIADVRGLGLFLGIEFQTNQQPDPGLTATIVNRMQRRGILLSIDGPHQNVIKIKPPLVFSQANVDTLISQLATILSSEVISKIS